MTRAIALVLVAILFLLSGCIDFGHRMLGARAALVPPDPKLCAKLQTRALWFGLSALGAGGVGSAASTISGDVTDTAPHWSLVGIGAGMAILGGVFGYLGTWYAAAFTHKGCQ